MANIKVLVLLTILVAVLHVRDVHSRKMTLEQIRTAVVGLKKACIKDTGAPKALVDKTQQGEFPPDRALQCYLKCLLEAMKGIWHDDFQEDIMLRQADLMLADDIVEPIKMGIRKCAKEITSKDLCEMAWQFTKCSYENDPERIALSDLQMRWWRRNRRSAIDRRKLANGVCRNRRRSRTCQKV